MFSAFFLSSHSSVRCLRSRKSNTVSFRCISRRLMIKKYVQKFYTTLLSSLITNVTGNNQSRYCKNYRYILAWYDLAFYGFFSTLSVNGEHNNHWYFVNDGIVNYACSCWTIFFVNGINFQLCTKGLFFRICSVFSFTELHSDHSISQVVYSRIFIQEDRLNN